MRDKQVLANEEIRKRQISPGYRYDSNGLYDSLVRSLFGKLHRLADEFQISIAKRGQRDRNAALQQALAHAEADFETKFGFQRGGETDDFKPGENSLPASRGLFSVGGAAVL